MTIDDIKNMLEEGFKLNHCEVINESPTHSNYSGDLSHIKIIIVSDDFVDESLVQRHKHVYSKIPEVVKTIHAISIIAKTKSEWDESNEFAASPPCSKN